MLSLPVQRDASPLPPGVAACMGAFDGFHLGHRALFEAAFAQCPSVAAVTFEPHPLSVLAPSRAPQLLQTPTQRLRVAASLGVERLVLLPFDRELASLGPDAFTQRFLIHGLRPTIVVVGADFRFGARRAGTAGDLRDVLAPFGIATEIVAPVPFPGTPDRKLSSTDVREAVANGRVDLAGAYLGRWHSVAGRVIPGAQRGRDIGYRTANVATPGAFLPPPGIYATILTVWDRRSARYGSSWPSVTSLGRNPTFVEDGPLSLEVHVLDHDLGEDLYDLDVEVAFVAHLRDELKFSDVAGLVQQIEVDIDAARERLGPDALTHVLCPPPEIPA